MKMVLFALRKIIFNFDLFVYIRCRTSSCCSILGIAVVNDENRLGIKITVMSCSGYCKICQSVHSLPATSAQIKAEELLHRLEKKKSLGILTGTCNDPNLSTEPLFGDARGKMFGVLKCLDRTGKTIWLYAFSGQYNGRWLVDGWVPPLFDIARFTAINNPQEKRIKQLGERLPNHPVESASYKTLTRMRRQLSRALMHDIHNLYVLRNCNGTRATLHEAFLHQGGKPTGTGDCCAPKLLSFAASSDLLPQSLAEFYFGKSNRSVTRTHGSFYTPCSEKCQPLLGFLLCGLDRRKGTDDG